MRKKSLEGTQSEGSLLSGIIRSAMVAIIDKHTYRQNILNRDGVLAGLNIRRVRAFSCSHCDRPGIQSTERVIWSSEGLLEIYLRWFGCRKRSDYPGFSDTLS